MSSEIFCRLIINSFQEQPMRRVLIKRCSENMQQIYRRTPMPKHDFNKVAKHFFRTHSPRNTSVSVICSQCTLSLPLKTVRFSDVFRVHWEQIFFCILWFHIYTITSYCVLPNIVAFHDLDSTI